MILKVIILLTHSTVILTNAVLGVPSPPYIVGQPTTAEIIFDPNRTVSHNSKSSVIECKAKGNPVPTYRWIKNGKDFNWRAYGDRISSEKGEGTLVFHSTLDEDRGQYQCFAENVWGVATSNSVFLRKAELGSFEKKAPLNEKAHEGAPFKLTCQPPNGWPKLFVYWLIQNSNGSFIHINSSRITLDPEGNLWFSNVTKQDESRDSLYVCGAVSVFRNEMKLGSRVNLGVISTGSSPKYVSPVPQYLSPRNEVAIRNKKVQLHCIFGGTPLPQIVWFKNKKILNTSDRISLNNYGKSLEIKQVTQEDEGTYTCSVDNGVGEPKSHSISLQILAEPYFIEEPQIVNSVENATETIYCKASGNPKPQINWIYNGRPISEAPTNPRRKIFADSIIIERLQKTDTGNYGCNATNSLGYVYKDVYVKVLNY